MLVGEHDRESTGTLVWTISRLNLLIVSDFPPSAVSTHSVPQAHLGGRPNNVRPERLLRRTGGIRISDLALRNPGGQPKRCGTCSTAQAISPLTAPAWSDKTGAPGHWSRWSGG